MSTLVILAASVFELLCGKMDTQRAVKIIHVNDGGVSNYNKQTQQKQTCSCNKMYYNK